MGIHAIDVHGDSDHVARTTDGDDVARAGDAARETISLETLAGVEKRGDLHGVGALFLLNGDRKQAGAYLARAGDSGAVLADRAALALANADPAGALAMADSAIERTAGHVSEQSAAMWNRGLALRDLGLSNGAAQAFRAVAGNREPGWAEEALRRAAALDAEFAAPLSLSLRVAAAAKTLAATFEGLSPEDARALPGMARIALYDAARAAPTREALAKLRPIAEAIDAVDHTTTAVTALDRRPDPALAKGYAEILAGHPPARATYLAALRSAKANDLLIGALIKFGTEYAVRSEDLPEFARLTASASDPWIRLLGFEQQALLAFERGDLPAAEAFTLRGREVCAAGAPNYRCMTLALLAGQVYMQWQRLPEAKLALDDAWRRVRASGQWEQQSELLMQFAQLAALSDDATGGGLPLARAYAGEIVARHKLMAQRGVVDLTCGAERWAREHIAMIEINRHRFADAAQLIAGVPACREELRPPSLYIRAQVAQLGGNPEGMLRVQEQLTAARAVPHLEASDEVVLDHAEGRLWIDRDPARAEQRLRHAIATIRSNPSLTANSRRFLGPSYALLAVAAGRRGDVAGAFEVLGEEIGATAPAKCALGLAADDTTVVAVARKSDTVAVAKHRARESVALDPASLVPDDVASAFSGCPVVDVFARPPIHGMAAILPPSVAWRYVSARSGPLGPSSARRVVIADVSPPPALGLPRLGVWSSELGDTISGANATPAHVLASFADAGDIVIHAHGLVDQANASYLALSPDPSGNYTLTAGAVRQTRLTGHPLVILAACSAARAAPVVHERWSLPDAFIAAGARAVLAATAEIPDAEATPFFDAVRDKVRAGFPVAIALRDVSQQWIVKGGQDWVRNVILFE